MITRQLPDGVLSGGPDEPAVWEGAIIALPVAAASPARLPVFGCGEITRDDTSDAGRRADRMAPRSVTQP